MTSDTSNLAALLPRQAELRPDATAIVDVDRTWTWRDVDDDAGRVAAALLDAGVAPGDRVGVHMYKCAAGFIAMHAVMRIGAVAVPLDPGSPTARLVRICEDMSISVICTHEPRAVATSDIAEAVPIDAILGVSGETAAERTIGPAQIEAFAPVPAAEVSGEDIAYIITSSGSTGEPKGIVHTHRSAFAYAEATVDCYDVDTSDVISDIAPHHFDISTFALWSAPLAGASIVVIPEPYQRLPASLSQRVEDTGITIWYSVPFLLQQLVERGDLENRDVTSLRWIKLGGEIIPPSIVEAIAGHAPNARVANVFGPAEVNQSSIHIITAASLQEPVIPVGKPDPNVRFRVTSFEATTPDAAEVDEGQLWVSSPQMMSSYFGKSEADSGIVHWDNTRWYRTGDVVRRGADGIYVFLGRVDNQVKVRGNRVELEGVEGVLEAHERVGSVVAAVRRVEGGNDYIVAGVIDPADDFDEREFLAHGANGLPPYASPALVVRLRGAETTGSGKLNRRVLRERLIEEVEGTTNA